MFRKIFDLAMGYRRVFPNLEAAASAVEPYLRFTPGPTEYADLHLELSTSARPSDYPALFHLNKVVNQRPETVVFDLGGCVGNLFYSYERYIDHPERLRWTVHDLPGILKEGERIAAKRASRVPTFTNSLDDAEGSDVLLISGALHYMAFPLGEWLGGMTRLPDRILINRTPLTESSTCTTVQDANGFLMPCRLLNRRELIESLTLLGYEMTDQWDVPELSVKIPFDPERSVSQYTGLYFQRVGDARPMASEVEVGGRRLN